MKKFLLVFALCCSFLLSSCNLGVENLVDNEMQSNESFAEEITEPDTQKPRYAVDYFDFTTYEIVQELGEKYIIAGYNGGTNLSYPEVEFILGQIYNFSGREKPGQIVVRKDLQLDDGLFKNMTYPELLEFLGDSINEPSFYENMLDDVCSYRTEFDYNGYSYTYEWLCDYEGQIEYNDRTCDYVIISNYESETIQYEDCLFDYGTREDAQAKIDLEVLGYEGCEIKGGSTNEAIFIDNEKYYVFYVYGYDGTALRQLTHVFASAQTDDIYVGTFQGYTLEPNIVSLYSDYELKDFSIDEFIRYGTTEQNCFRYYTKDFR